MADLPELAELDINPLLADGDGVIALDARIALAPAAGPRARERLAIRPYPHELEETHRLAGRAAAAAPDPARGRAAAQPASSTRCTPEDVRLRFFSQAARAAAQSQLARLTQIDYDREMAFIASRADAADGSRRRWAWCARSPIPTTWQAEFAIIVRSDLKGHGLGRLLMHKLIAYCRSRGTRRLVGQALPDNANMLRLARECGFELGAVNADGILLTLPLRTE